MYGIRKIYNRLRERVGLRLKNKVVLYPTHNFNLFLAYNFM